MFIDKPKNNIIVIIIAALIILGLVFLGGRYTHEMYEKWQQYSS